jgi:hypothetical protein
MPLLFFKKDPAHKSGVFHKSVCNYKSELRYFQLTILRLIEFLLSVSLVYH